MSDQLNMRVVRITPEVATLWLAEQTNIRRIQQGHVRQLADDMRGGGWYLNGDAIRFDENGRLVDGFHRLHACIDANVPFQTYVVRGLETDPDVLASIDVGQKRSHGQILISRGKWTQQFARAATAGAKWYFALKAGKMDTLCNNRSVTVKMSAVQICRIAEETPLIAEAVDLYTGKNSQYMRRFFSPMGAWVGLYAYLGEIDHELVADMFRRLANGDVVPETPLAHLSRYLHMNRNAFQPDMPLIVLTKAIKAWNAMREGKQMRVLRFNRSEGFPTAV